VTKSRNRKLIRVTSSNEYREQKGVDFSDYIYLNQIWYEVQSPHYKHAKCPKFTELENPRWRWPPSWISEKNVNNYGLDKDISTKFYGKVHHGHAKIATWPKVETGSYFAWRHLMNIWNKRASISMSIAYYLNQIWDGAQAPHYEHEEMCQIYLTWKSKMARRHLEFLKKTSITPDWIQIFAPIWWNDASRPCGDDHMTKSRNRKLICVTSSNEYKEQNGVDLSDYNR